MNVSFETTIDELSLVNEGSYIYRGATIKNSQIEQKAVVGDFSRIYSSQLDKYVRIDRNNLIYHSSLGQCSYTGSNDVLMHTQIGKYCSISWGVTIGPGEHDYELLTSHDFLYNNFYGINEGLPQYDRYSKPCIIGNDVWIGTNATVLRGITIGDGAVIGANSLVNKDVPPYAIVAGCPAKIIKYRFEQDIIHQLLELKWWNYPMEVLKENFKFITSRNIIDIIKKMKAL